MAQRGGRQGRGDGQDPQPAVFRQGDELVQGLGVDDLLGWRRRPELQHAPMECVHQARALQGDHPVPLGRPGFLDDMLGERMELALQIAPPWLGVAAELDVQGAERRRLLRHQLIDRREVLPGRHRDQAERQAVEHPVGRQEIADEVVVLGRPPGQGAHPGGASPGRPPA
jgi:hypothetical protein